MCCVMAGMQALQELAVVAKVNPQHDRQVDAGRKGAVPEKPA